MGGPQPRPRTRPREQGRRQTSGAGQARSDLRQLVQGKQLSLVRGFSAERVDERAALSERRRSDRSTALSSRRANDLIWTWRASYGSTLIRGSKARGSWAAHRSQRALLWYGAAARLQGALPSRAGYFAVGIKSYGRAPTFLMVTGYEQVRSVAAHLAGDHAAADDVPLVLAETGVCSASVAADAQQRTHAVALSQPEWSAHVVRRTSSPRNRRSRLRLHDCRRGAGSCSGALEGSPGLHRCPEV
jgi:hypothetical protein